MDGLDGPGWSEWSEWTSIPPMRFNQKASKFGIVFTFEVLYLFEDAFLCEVIFIF